VRTDCIEKQIAAMWEQVTTRLLRPDTDLIYDFEVPCVSDYPSAEEVRNRYPNPCGYSTGMEDGMIAGGTMLDACLVRYALRGEAFVAALCHRLVAGMLACCEAAQDGFVPRALCPNAQDLFYPDSSRDQYTMLLFGFFRFLESGLCDETERARIASVCVAIARRARNNVTEKNGYDLLRADGKPSLNCVMWGQGLSNHEICRLPLIYLMAWHTGADEASLAAYRAIRTEVLARSLPMQKQYGSFYTLQQMQAALYVCGALDPEARADYRRIMQTVATYTEGKRRRIRRRFYRWCDRFTPRPFRTYSMEENKERTARFGTPWLTVARGEDEYGYFITEDLADLAIVPLLADRPLSRRVRRTFLRGVRALPPQKSNLGVYFLQAYYRLLSTENKKKAL